MEHDVEALRRVGGDALEWAAGYMAGMRNHAVTSDIQPGELIDRLPAQGPELGEPLEAIFADFERLILPAVTHWNHPRFFNYFACSASVPGVVAELLAATLNTNGLNWVASPAVSELEQVTLAWLRQWMGLSDDYFGEIFDTASISSLHGVMAAREFVDPDSRLEGVRKPLMVYCSDQAHSSIDKVVIAAGLGLNNLRKIESDDEFRMRPDKLAEAMAADAAAGRTPCCVVATLGTTSTTSVDPLDAIIDIAGHHNAWVHVDAAYAGAAALLPEYKWMMRGIERAHSYVMNPHKWLFTQMDCSTFYTRRPDILRRAFAITPEYLRTTADSREVNLMDYGVALGRRFRSLKLWFILRYFGREKLIELIRGHNDMAQHLAARMVADPRFSLAAPVPFSTVCFRVHDSEPRTRALVAAINQTREVFISQTILKGHYAGRIAIGNQATDTADLEVLWNMLSQSADAV